MNVTGRHDQLRISSPCPMNWEQMTGDDRVRFCDSCNLNVYNIARLTQRETDALIAGTEGRICARLFRRSDGTVITRDCPVGLRAIRRRAARVTGAVFATIVGLCSTIIGQKLTLDEAARNQQITISRSDSQTETSVISGTIVDQNGAVIAGAAITVSSRDKKSKVDAAKTNAEGFFRVALPSGSYVVKVKATGFKSLVVSEIKLAEREALQFQGTLFVEGNSVTVGLLMSTEPLSTTTPSNSRTFSEDLLRRIPIR